LFVKEAWDKKFWRKIRGRNVLVQEHGDVKFEEEHGESPSSSIYVFNKQGRFST
jgi:hypothetical protein